VCAVVIVPLEVGEGVLVDVGGGTSGLSCVAQVLRYVFVTPVPLAFEPD
jgi:Ethanolamine utilization protein EutJ (predicted chaperonin)